MRSGGPAARRPGWVAGRRPGWGTGRRQSWAALALLAVLSCSQSDPIPVSQASPSGSAAAVPSTLPSSPASTPLRDPLGSGNAVTIAFGGDVHFEGASRSALTGGMRDIAPLLSKADIAMVNLETAVTERGTAASKEFTFRSPATAFGALRGAGVDVVTMANNHGEDYGEVGLRDSLDAARAARFPVVGIGLDAAAAFRPWRVTVRGQRLAFLGATHVLDNHLKSAWSAGAGKPGLASAYDEATLLRAVTRARATSDTVVVYLHWGEERRSCPIARQTDIAAKLTRAGADVVVGSHAHVLLGAGMLGSSFVSYGLGNFVFYARGGAGAQTGVLTVNVTGSRINSYAWAPAVISGGVPRPLSGAAAAAAQQRWASLRGCTGLKP